MQITWQNVRDGEEIAGPDRLVRVKFNERAAWIYLIVSHSVVFYDMHAIEKSSLTFRELDAPCHL